VLKPEEAWFLRVLEARDYLSNKYSLFKHCTLKLLPIFRNISLVRINKISNFTINISLPINVKSLIYLGLS